MLTPSITSPIALDCGTASIVPSHARTHRADALKSEVEGYRNRERDLVARAALAQTDLEAVQGELKRVQVRLRSRSTHDLVL